jgi:hypothetical protein
VLPPHLLRPQQGRPQHQQQLQAPCDPHQRTCLTGLTAVVLGHLQQQQLGLPLGLLLQRGPRLLLRAVPHHLHELQPPRAQQQQQHLALLLRRPLLGVRLLVGA